MSLNGARRDGVRGAVGSTSPGRSDAQSPVGDPSLPQQIRDLESLDRDALLALWVATLGGEAPSRLSQPSLRRVLAFELQARAHGGLPAAAVRKLERLAAEQGAASGRSDGSSKAASREGSAKLKPGGRLLREWGGVTHVVDVVEGGIFWRGERHRSLSAIARAITGAHWSGPRFFGLTEPEAANDAKPKRAATHTRAVFRPSRRAA